MSAGPLLLALAVLTAAGPRPAEAQARGAELFQLMLRGGLARTTGTTRLQWLPRGMGYLVSEADSASGGRAFYRVDPRTERRSPLFDAAAGSRLGRAYEAASGTAVKGLPFTQFEFARDGGAIRFRANDAEWLYDLDRGELRKLLQPSKVGPLDFATTEPGEFSPDFNQFAFIRDYDNLFVLDTRTGQEERLTTGTSEDNAVGFLGAGSWFVWSPDSRRIAYLKADQRGFPQYPILKGLEQAARVERMRYPFTNTPTAPLELWVVDLETKEHRKLASNGPDQPFIRDLTWLPDGKELAFQLVNQWESRLELKAADPVTGQVRTVLIDEVPSFLDPPHNFHVLADGKRFLWSSERSGWRHVFLYDLAGEELAQLTRGDFETEQVVGVDEAGGWVYVVGYTSLGMDRHLFRVKLDGTGVERLTPEDGFHVVSMDPAARFFTDDFSAIASPRAVRLRSADGRLVRELASTNTDRVTELGLLPPEVITVKAADGVTDVQGLLFKPADFDPSKRYPVIVPVYGGPHSKQNRNGYLTLDFRAQLAQLGFLVAEFDVRGTPRRGKAYQAGNYLKLGQVDVDDQAAALRQLGTRPYVDGSRVGVTGISHGGYMTLMMMLRYPGVFQVGVAGAPITDLRNGPRQYIGRFMRTPEANPEGYEKANVLNHADQLAGHLLLFHGTDDRNAVLGNSMQLLRKLIDTGRPVDLMIYPDGVHVLTGRDGVYQMKKTIAYFLEHLRPEGWERSLAQVWSR